MTAPTRLPLFIDLNRKRILVVGGGNVAASKLPTLLATGALVTLVAPQICPAAILEGVSIRRRPFRSSDLRACGSSWPRRHPPPMHKSHEPQNVDAYSSTQWTTPRTDRRISQQRFVGEISCSRYPRAEPCRRWRDSCAKLWSSCSQPISSSGCHLGKQNASAGCVSEYP